MKKLLTAAYFVMVSLVVTSCSDKGGDDGPTPPDPCSETKLDVATTPPINSNVTGVIGADYPITINIKAGFPAAGATINVNAKNETTNAVIADINPATVTAGVNNVNITGTPAGASVIVTVTVTSKNCATNKWTGTLRYSRK